jgi:hypothetical protein
MPQFDLNKPNIFMRFYLNEHKEDKQIMFLYSDTNGVKNVEKVLSENPLFFNLLSPIEVLTKMNYEISGMFISNNYSELRSARWTGKFVVATSNDDYDFPNEFKKWKHQLEQFVGSENLFQVTIPEAEIDECMRIFKNENPEDRDKGLFSFIENYRLKLDLEDNLELNPQTKKFKL